MEEQYKDARRLIESEVLYCQTYLVEHLIKEGDIDFWEIMRNGQQGTPEVFEWWLVTEGNKTSFLHVEGARTHVKG